MSHAISVSRGGVTIPASRISIDFDAVSHTRTASIALAGRAARAMVEPEEDGTPALITASIDGHDWLLRCEGWQESESWGRYALSAQCRGLSWELDAPWQPQESGAVGVGLTVQQVLAAFLPLGSGFALEWPLGDPDWAVPEGAWSWTQQTPLGAIHAATQALGLRIDPARDARTLTIRHRYPVLPWLYGTATPDVVIPRHALLSSSRSMGGEPAVVGVWVHGGDVGGVIAHVRRTASAGEPVAATQSHPLVTHEDAARVLGGRVLAGLQRGTWREINIPLGGDYPLIDVGALIEIDAGAETERATVSAASVSAAVDSEGRVQVRQRLRLGEDSGNAFAGLLALLPDAPTLLGSVVSSDGGVSVVELLGGGVVVVRGSAAEGDGVWVRGGEIVGSAPSLPSYVIDV